MKTVTIVIMVLALCNQAYALTFMGPPKAELDQGQYSLGIDFTYSEMDLDIGGLTQEIETNTFFSNLGYGFADKWEGFLRLGVSNIDADDIEFGIDFDSDNEFAYGFGTKFTFAEQNSVSWGALLQIAWFEGEDTFAIVDMDFDAYEIQMAFGPTYEANGLKIYGGPFLHFVEGDYDVGIVGFGSDSFEIEEESVFGGYIGAQIDIAANSSFNIETQFTGDAWAFALGIGWKF